MAAWLDGSRLNWRINDRFCVRFLPGLLIPDIVWRRKERYIAIMFPGLGIAFDYEDVRTPSRSAE